MVPEFWKKWKYPYLTAYIQTVLRSRYIAWMLPIIGVFIIASPLSDEMGVSLFILISYLSNAVGILMIASVAKVSWSGFRNNSRS